MVLSEIRNKNSIYIYYPNSKVSMHSLKSPVMDKNSFKIISSSIGKKMQIPSCSRPWTSIITTKRFTRNRKAAFKSAWTNFDSLQHNSLKILLSP